MNKFFLIGLMLFFNLANAQQSHVQEEAVCYLPTHSNVAYSELAELPVGSPNEVFSYGDQPFQFGELWLPLDDTLPDSSVRLNPLVILVHGGCWLNSFDIKHTHALSTALSRSGYAVWSVEYRRTGDQGGGWPGSYNDIKASIEYLPNFANHPIDLSQVAIVGHSAGGHLALLAGADALYDFSAVIGLAAIVDLEHYSKGANSCQRATTKFMGGEVVDIPQIYQIANPAERELHPLTVLIHGTQDAIVSIDHAHGSTARNHSVDGAGHFDMIHPGTPSFQSLLKELANAFAGAKKKPTKSKH